MCGIAGYCDFTRRTESGTLKAMTDAVAYRGPDDSGILEKDCVNAWVGFGHRRLSILDLSPLGHQPYQYQHLTLVFNGEIYNFQEVRELLIPKGYSFKSNSDTEVIIKAYDAWGMKCLDYFIGMFAFALLDEKLNKIYLVRDRAGVKPLYYYWKNGTLLFGSELKSFHKHPAFDKELNLDSLALYLQYSYIPAPHSIFLNTFKLQPGSFLELSLEKKELQCHRYWNVVDHYNKPKFKISYHDAEEQLEQLFKSAFAYRMIADVPVGVFLSGGYDSSAVAAILQSGRTEKLKTFTIGFEEENFNEAPHAKKVARHLGTDHEEHYCTKQEAFTIIPRLPDIYDEPFGDNSIIPTTLVSQVAAKKVKVVLSADGGDEIFGGYTKFKMALRYTQLAPAWLQSMLSYGMGLIDPAWIPGTRSSFNFRTRYRKMQMIWGNQNPLFAMKVISQFNTEQELRKRMIYPFENQSTDFDLQGLNETMDPIDKMLAIDFRTFLVDNNLTKVDRATMSVSIEGREPLLDHRIVEFAAQLPSEYKWKDGHGKRILKNIVHKYITHELMNRPKMGFVVPIMSWFRSEMSDLLMEHLDERMLSQDGIFNVEEVVGLRDRYLAGYAENVQKLWHILIFQMWKKRWM